MMKKYLVLLFFVVFSATSHAENPDQVFPKPGGKTGSDRNLIRTVNGVAVPSDFPEIEVHQYGATGPGKIFFISTFGNLGNYLIILNNDGTPYFYRRYPDSPGFWNGNSADFQMQPTGDLTAFIAQRGCYIALDHNYHEIDTYSCQGYPTDSHDLLFLSNGHALVIGGDNRIVDMSQFVEGGNEHANVLAQVIQELDENKHVIKEWNCWDHYAITDAVHENLTGGTIDFTHLNSMAFDYDSNLVISVRNLSEITKINWETGDIMWKFGGVNNQFQITGDPYENSYQHDVKPVPGKPNHYTMFDNGNHREVHFSRAVEYKIEPVNKTAEMVWEFDLDQERFTQMMGSVQTLPNGNRFIDWCEWPPLYACEVDTNNQIVYELTAHDVSSYRSRRFEWEGMLQEPYLIAESYYTGINLIFNKFGDPNVDHYNIYADTQPNPTSLLTTTQDTYVFLTGLENHTDWYFRVTAVDPTGTESDYSNEEQVTTTFIAPGENMILNGDFSEGTDSWILLGSESTGEIDNQGQYHIYIENGGINSWDVSLNQGDIKLIKGNTYLFEFDAYANSERVINGFIQRSVSRFENYGQIDFQYLTPQKQHFAYEFQMQYPTDFSAQVIFHFGGQSNSDIYLDNVSLKEIPTDNEGSPPAEYILSQNYPNPFNHSTRIVFQIPGDEFVALELFNMLGQKVRTIVSEYKKADSYEVKLDAQDLPSGHYFYRLKTASFSQMRKMILVK